MENPENKWRTYRDGELDLILSLVPTKANVARLASSLGRSKDAITIVFRMAYTKFGRQRQGIPIQIQRKKIAQAKKKAGIIL